MITIRPKDECPAEYELRMDIDEMETLRDALSTAIKEYSTAVKHLDKQRLAALEARDWDNYNDLCSHTKHIEDDLKKLDTFKRALNLFV